LQNSGLFRVHFPLPSVAFGFPADVIPALIFTRTVTFAAGQLFPEDLFLGYFCENRPKIFSFFYYLGVLPT